MVVFIEVIGEDGQPEQIEVTAEKRAELLIHREGYKQLAKQFGRLSSKP